VGKTSRFSRDGSLAQRRQDVGAVAAAHVTLGAVVADGEPRAHIAVDGAGRAVLRGAANFGRGDPDDLGEVTPTIKVGHVGVAFAVAVGRELPDLAVVPQVSDGLGDNLGGINAGNVARGAVDSNVLAVRASGSTGGPRGRLVQSTTVKTIKIGRVWGHVQIVGVHARGGDGGGVAGQVAVPARGRRRVVGTVQVVVVDSSAAKVGRLRVGGGGSRGGSSSRRRCALDLGQGLRSSLGLDSNGRGNSRGRARRSTLGDGDRLNLGLRSG
jgi:hypothetical protein